MFGKKENRGDIEIAKLKKELEETKKKVEENLAGWKRALADFSNFKKEKESEQKEFVKFSQASLILEILPVLDNFEAAWKTLPRDMENNSWVIGVGHVKSQLENLIKSKGVEKFGNVGEKFDPQIHEAVESGENKKPASTDDTESSRLHRENVTGKTLKVVEIMQRGYKLHGKVIRPARVVVSQQITNNK